MFTITIYRNATDCCQTLGSTRYLYHKIVAESSTAGKGNSDKGMGMFFPCHCGNTAVVLLISILVTGSLYLAYLLTHRVKLIAWLLYGE